MGPQGAHNIQWPGFVPFNCSELPGNTLEEARPASVFVCVCACKPLTFLSEAAGFGKKDGGGDVMINTAWPLQSNFISFCNTRQQH